MASHAPYFCSSIKPCIHAGLLINTTTKYVNNKNELVTNLHGEKNSYLIIAMDNVIITNVKNGQMNSTINSNKKVINKWHKLET